jgi:hypothetical protein
MKLLGYGLAGSEKPGVLDNKGHIRDLSQAVSDLAQEVQLPESLERLRALNLNNMPLVPEDVRMTPCVAAVGKFICAGLGQKPPKYLRAGTPIRLGVDGLGEQNQNAITTAR